MERETLTIETPIDKHKVMLKAWITGKEKRELRNIFFEGIKFSGKEAESIGNSAEIMNKAEDKAIETVVVSVNGKQEGILDLILGMKMQDYDFVKAEINKITAEQSFLE